jgi:hypothetical protein
MDDHVIVWITGGVFLVAVVCGALLFTVLPFVQKCCSKKEDHIDIHRAVGVSGLERLMLPEDYGHSEKGAYNKGVDSSLNPPHSGDVGDGVTSFEACPQPSIEGRVAIDAAFVGTTSSSQQPWLSRRDPWVKGEGNKGASNIDKDAL